MFLVGVSLVSGGGFHPFRVAPNAKRALVSGILFNNSSEKG